MKSLSGHAAKQGAVLLLVDSGRLSCYFLGMAKLLIGTGVLLIGLGFLWQMGLFKIVPLGRLPGDIRIEGKNSTFYFPITTCLVLSLIGSGIFQILKRLF